ncbi:mitochondrial chaperone BCS1-B [Pyrus ussuriensis x Pyrus communis]|uniref:Mitochondrial chaperone BCS1-B n=1 Tax=Pyrus ussuriensis x Pyrus communis TaxID=2448454 RepID=A0A5N5HJX7_9ROSA|nr:mitochondrial chaperone BCS1-B [Pyrus ussuriensis x Pyrus communis]
MAMLSSQHPKLAGPLSSVSPAYVVEEFIDGRVPNQMFEALNVYLHRRLSLSSPTHRIMVNNNSILLSNEDTKNPNPELNFTSKDQNDYSGKPFRITVDTTQELVDIFKGVAVKWVLVSFNQPCSDEYMNEARHFELSFLDNSRRDDMFLSSYLTYILKKSDELTTKNLIAAYIGDGFLVAGILLLIFRIGDLSP